MRRMTTPMTGPITGAMRPIAARVDDAAKRRRPMTCGD